MLIIQEFVMRPFVSGALRVVAVLAVSASVAQAQTETLMYDHVHMSVPNPQASAQWFHDHIGGEWVDGRTDRLLFGTTRIMWLGSRGEERRPSAGGVIDHLGFSFANLSAKLAEVEGVGVQSWMFSEAAGHSLPDRCQSRGDGAEEDQDSRLDR